MQWGNEQIGLWLAVVWKMHTYYKQWFEAQVAPQVSTHFLTSLTNICLKYRIPKELSSELWAFIVEFEKCENVSGWL